MRRQQRTQRADGRRGLAGELGFTLVELMVAVLLFGLLSAGTLAMLSGQQETSQGQLKANDALDNARAVLNLLARQLQVAKAGVPDGKLQVNVTSNLPTVISPCASGEVPMIEVINHNDQPDELHIVVPDGQAWGTAAADVANNLGVVTFNMWPTSPQPEFKDGWVLNTDYTSGLLFFATGATNCSSPTCTFPRTNGGTAATIVKKGNTLVAARWLRYHITDTVFGPERPVLAVQELLPTASVDEPAAAGIEDIQIALALDRPIADGKIGTEFPGSANSDEWLHNVAGETFVSTGFADKCDLKTLLAVRITVVARAQRSDVSVKGKRPAIEDRPKGPDDTYYRVVLRRVVGLRQ